MESVMAELNKLPRVIAIDVDALAKETGSPRSANMVLLGATAAVLDILDPDKLRDGIRRIFGRKGEDVVDANIKAFDAGLASAQK
jgi:indolepyruvate ferredoxin oxidoreductase beta subunit